MNREELTTELKLAAKLQALNLLYGTYFGGTLIALSMSNHWTTAVGIATMSVTLAFTTAYLYHPNIYNNSSNTSS